MDQFVYGFPPLQESLEKLSSLNEQQFKMLHTEVTGARGFARSLERCESLAAELRSDLAPRDIFNLLTSLQFLYDSSRRWEKTAHDGHDALHEFFEFTGLKQSLGEMRSTCYERLRQLIAVNPEVERRRKRRRLKSRLIDTAVDFASFVDLRPSFSANRESIEELIPVVILQIVLNTEHGPSKSCVFQMSTDGVAKLRDTLDDIDKRLSATRSDAAFNSRLEIATAEDIDDGDD